MFNLHPFRCVRWMMEGIVLELWSLNQRALAQITPPPLVRTRWRMML